MVNEVRKMDIRQKIEELVIKADALNSNMLMARDAIVEGSNAVENYEWSLYNLHEKTFDLKEELEKLEDFLFQKAKEARELSPVS